MGDAAGVLIARGTRAAEALLLAELAKLDAASRRDARLLTQPVRIVVPSRSLREHLAAAIVRHFGRSVAGVSVQTLHALALELRDRSRAPSPRGELLLPILVRRVAREEAALREALDELEDGYGAVTAVVTDLLDAGFEPDRSDALLKVLSERDSQPVRRARALVRVAARISRELASAAIEHRSVLLRLARQALEAEPDAALPARAIFVHGFAEATGVAIDLIEALVRHCGARVLIDHPPDPAAPQRTTSGVAFTRRIRERLGAVPVSEIRGDEEPAPPRIDLVRAPGADAEVRAVAGEIRALLDEGMAPERVGVVARHLGLFRVPIRRHFDRLGIPFSGAPGTAGPADPRARRAQALIDLLRQRSETPAERWLDALAALRVAPTAGARPPPLRGAARADLRLGLHALGAARLEDVAELSVATLLGEADAFALPVRRGLVAAEAGDASDVDGAPRALRRGLPRAVLSGAVAAARALLARFAGWPERDRVHVHLQHLRASLCEDLGFAPAGDEFRSLDDKLALLERETPDAMTLSTDEFAWLVRDVLLDIGTTPLGGAGGGVAVLDVTAARARSFERLFVLGMNRDVFPRTMREDPLLPDSLRRALAAALPDLPIKETGYDEERYLFAQLVSASPRVALSWHYVDDDGQARARSPLLERLCAEAGVKETRAPSPAARPAQSAEKRPRPASEYALLAGLYGSRDQFARILPAALRESRSELRALDSRVEAGALARARFGVLCELDPDLRSRRGRERARSLGPYCGFLGPTQESADPRRSAPFVTTLERMAGCAWQVLLEKLLRLEPTPDALEALPAVDALLIGNTVHRVLEQIAGPATEADVTLREVLSRSPRRVRWPPEAELARILASTADRVRRDAGYALPGFTRVLVALAQPYLAAARERLPELFALGTEVVGSVPEPEGDRPIRFRADLVERVDGAARITDYKTGKPLSDKKRPSTRQAELARRIARGTNLQAVAYALGADEPDATGRYLFLKPELDSDAASLGVDASDADRVADFRRAVGTVFAAWDAGSFFPRLSEPGKDGEPARCGWCPVSQACLRGDSGARRRLRACAEEAGAAPPDTAPAEAAFASLWQLPARQAAGSEERT